MNPRRKINTRHEPTCDELNAAMRQQQDAEVQRLNAPTWNELASAAGIPEPDRRAWFFGLFGRNGQ